jgi:acyl-CoA reductase-like NAD-dependent aldehyde dehydrogenase
MTKKFQIISPSTGDIFAERPYADNTAIRKALDHSLHAFDEWKMTRIAKRAEICTNAVDYFRQNAKAWGMEITMQMGRPIRYSPKEITGGFAERAGYMIGCADKALSRITLPEKKGFSRFIKKEPLGTVFVLAPWNYPYLTAVNAVIPALMAGNTVIMKHSEQTALCAERFLEAFQHAGLPDGVFQYLHLNHEQAAEIITKGEIAHVAFTGSVEGGRAVQQAAADRFLTSALELGGKDPAYVTSDANIPQTAENLADGSFFNSGQSCCGVERIYVHKQVYEEFLEAFLSAARSYKLGDPADPETTLGPMVRKENAERADRVIRQAIEQGAEALIRPGDYPELGYPWLAPQVLVNVNHDMEVMREETFAPVAGVMPAESDEEAIRMMNDSPYGLTASIWTEDPEKAVFIGDKVETGTWFMNRCDYLDPALAWTGVKNSGRGCSLSILGYNHLTRPKSYHIKHKQS